MGLRDRLQNFLTRQCLPGAMDRADDASNGGKRSFKHSRSDSQDVSWRTSSSGGMARSNSACTDDSAAGGGGVAPRRKLSPRAALVAQMRASSRAPSRREQLLMLIILACVAQIATMRRATATESLISWISDPITTDEPEPGRPASRHAFLPPKDVLAASPDACAQALNLPRVALMFLTTGDLYHEDTWRMWFKSAWDVLPSQAVAGALCGAEGASAAVGAASAACRPSSNATNAIERQHLFSVYIHAPPEFPGYRKNSLWAGRLVQHRVKTSWGAHTLVEATRHLLWEAFRDPLNTRFLLLSESDIPLYDPLTLWQQLQAETRSRLDTCRHELTSPWRWDPRMETSRLKFHHWRKSPQWMAMTRDHVDLALSDEEVYRKFEKHCWSAWDERHGRWHRDCFSDEHYFATLLAAEGRDEEGVCGARGVSFTEWEAGSAHPRSFGPEVIDVDLIKRARAAPVAATGKPTRPCDWGAAQQAAAALFVSKDAALGAQSVDLCSRMWRQPPAFRARMPETCFLTARKFPLGSRERVREVFLQCGAGVELLRPDVCEAEGGRRCGTFIGRVKGLFQRDPC